MFPANALHFADIETPRYSNGYPSNMHPFLFAIRHNCLDNIACLKPFDNSTCLCTCARKTILVWATHLAALATDCFDQKRLCRRIKLDRPSRLPHARRVNPMGFGIPLIYPIELGVPTGAGRKCPFSRRAYAYSFELLEQMPPH